MTALKVTLPEPLDQFVEDQVRSGAYPDAEAVVRAGVALLRDDAEAEAAKEVRFQRLIQEGLDELDRGEGIEVTDLEAFFDEIMAEVEAEFEMKSQAQARKA